MAHPPTISLEKKSASIGTDDSSIENRKGQVHRASNESDDLEGHLDSVENDVFDHKSRYAILQNGEFSPPSGTILEAIFQELKRKERHEKKE